jgi:hypothetical protein
MQPTEIVAPFVDVTRDPDGHGDGREHDGGLVQPNEATISASVLRAALRGEGSNNSERVTLAYSNPSAQLDGAYRSLLQPSQASQGRSRV